MTIVRILAVLVVAVLLTAPAAHAESRPLALGDSVMLGAVQALKARGITVDAKVSRQATSAPALLRKYRTKLPRDVFLHFGTNGTYPLRTCKRVVSQLGPKHRVFLVTVKVPRSWEATNNQMLRRCAALSPNARIVDWNWAASRHPGWLYADGYHLRPIGARNFARILDEAVQRADREERVGLITPRGISAN